MLLINLSVGWGMEMRVFKMATIKPVQPSIVDSIDIWKKIVETVLKKNYRATDKKMQQETEKFKKVCIAVFYCIF